MISSNEIALCGCCGRTAPTSWDCMNCGNNHKPTVLEYNPLPIEPEPKKEIPHPRNENYRAIQEMHRRRK